ncbi:26S proteasome non-ATPase regulatory subunit 6-like [Watersipora subatra]|uniref:26S proteasome non-ATPase regulatory subunit 6-like n=1 Tax=Watersipora subatra TaxID=2589382 RepID=UPI00355AEF2D
MPIENMAEEGLEKNPNLQLAQWKFMLTTKKYKNDKEIKSQIMASITADNMAPFYEELCADLDWTADTKMLEGMKQQNATALASIEESIKDAEESLGETEVRDLLIKKAEHFSRIGDKEACLEAFRKAEEKIHTIGCKLDTVFHLIRLGLFYFDHDLTSRNIDRAQTLIDEGGDWDRRNRLKVYKAVNCMANRQFKEATEYCLDAVATFTSYELMDYSEFIVYTIILGMEALTRPVLREKVVQGAEILEVLHSKPDLKEYLMSLYNCRYAEFFKRLASIEQKLRYDRYLHKHYRYYVREMRVLAYNQLLQSYHSLTLEYMAKAFGVTIAFIDQELSRLIAAGRLHAKIDKVGGIVETNRPDSKNYQYQDVIKQGDLLLNRVQKLSRVINI